MIESILVATDGSECSDTAEQYALALASKLGARLSGLTVVEERDVRAPGDGGLTLTTPFPESQMSSYYRARAESVARRLGERGQAAGVNVSCEILQGAADDRIVEKSQGADLLIIGRDGKDSPRPKALVGSTVDGVVRKTGKPTIVVPSGAKAGGPIVLGFDGSPGSRLAADLAVVLANGLQESVHVFVDSKDKGRASARFDEVRQLVAGLSVPVREASSTLGRPDVKLVDNSKEAGAGLVAMGAFGRNRISDYFLGSNAAAVVRTSSIAVLLAR